MRKLLGVKLCEKGKIYLIPDYLPNTELAFDNEGKKLVQDPNGVDTEAIIKLKDGCF